MKEFTKTIDKVNGTGQLTKENPMEGQRLRSFFPRSHGPENVI
jgi:hypothetical protein